MMKKLNALVLMLLLTSCGGLPKVKPQPALYDFGIAPTASPTALPKIRWASIEATPGLEGSDMRYRLAYRNPTQIFAYTESRWAASPDKLLARRLAQKVSSAGKTQCTLHLALETFEQIFDTPDRSRGLVRLRATLSDDMSRRAAVRTMLASSEHAAASADAQGGVAALTMAADDAIAQIVDWARTQPCGETPNA